MDPNNDQDIIYELEGFNSIEEFKQFLNDYLNESEFTSRIDHLMKFFAEQVQREQILTNELSALFNEVANNFSISDDFISEDVIVVSDNLNDVKKSIKQNLTNISNSYVRNLAIGMKLMAQRSSDCWSKATLIDIFNPQLSIIERTYKVRFEDNIVKMVGSRSLSHAHSNMIITIGSRIICRYDPNIYKHFYSGIVAEIPCSRNQNRYLIFFEDGYAKYANANEIQPVYYQSSDVWEDVNQAFGVFIKEYLEMFPDRPMVRLRPGLPIKTEYKGEWLLAVVHQIDCSLVEMVFEKDGRSEWIYRGSTRLEPLFKGLAHVEEMKSAKIGRRRAISHIRSTNKPFIEYTHSEDIPLDGEYVDENAAKESVVKKSTIEKSSKTENKMLGICKSIKLDAILPVRLRSDQKKACRRFCTSNCLGVDDDDPFKLFGHNPLVIPLLYCWERYLVKKSCRKSIIVYKAPCGKKLKSMEELVNFLDQTNSKLTIDLFSIDPCLNTDNVFTVFHPKVDIPDITNNEERVPIRCVNSFDRSIPEFTEYSRERVPSKGVILNTDENFLLCCDCTDNCKDRKKCPCMQLTIEATQCIPNNKDPKTGYKHKRLMKSVVTGIYECNKKCGCDYRCQNRVAQLGLKLRLLLFKTRRKGWGLCCLDDIPKGCFICIYAGQLLTEETATLDGKEYGDEYLAELDHIEVVEKLKEGYESDVEMNDDEEEIERENKSDSDFEYDVIKKKEKVKSKENFYKRGRAYNSSSSNEYSNTEKMDSQKIENANTFSSCGIKKNSSINFYSKTKILPKQISMEAPKNTNIDSFCDLISNDSNNAEYIYIDSLMNTPNTQDNEYNNDLTSNQNNFPLNRDSLINLINNQMDEIEKKFCKNMTTDLIDINQSNDIFIKTDLSYAKYSEQFDENVNISNDIFYDGIDYKYNRNEMLSEYENDFNIKVRKINIGKTLYDFCKNIILDITEKIFLRNVSKIYELENDNCTIVKKDSILLNTINISDFNIENETNSCYKTMSSKRLNSIKDSDMASGIITDILDDIIQDIVFNKKYDNNQVNASSKEISTKTLEPLSVEDNNNTETKIDNNIKADKNNSILDGMLESNISEDEWFIDIEDINTDKTCINGEDETGINGDDENQNIIITEPTTLNIGSEIAEDRDSDKESSQSIFHSLPNPKEAFSTLNNKEHPSVISTRKLFGEEYCYIIDAKSTGNIGKYFNHSCSPNVFVQNVFIDTHDLRFPTVAFFANEYIKAGTELTWDYGYEIGSVPNKILYCYCESTVCKGRLL